MNQQIEPDDTVSIDNAVNTDNAANPGREPQSAATDKNEFRVHEQLHIDCSIGQLLLESGLQPLGKREHPLEAKLALHEVRQLGYHAIEYEGYVNIFTSQDVLVGGLQLQRRWNVAVLYSLWVEPQLRGEGIGVILMQAAERLTRQMGASGIVLETSTLHSYEFYLKYGFEITSSIDDYIPGEQVFQMLKRIPEAGE